jgi:hypothetical protein
MEQRRRVVLSRTTGLFCFECFPFETFLSLSLSSSLGSTRIALPLPAARRGALPSSPFGLLAVCASSARGRAARSAPPRRRYVRSSLFTITPHRDRTDKHSLSKLRKQWVRRLASRRDERHALAGAPLTRRHERRSRHTMLFLRDTRARHGTALREHKALHSTPHIGT